MEILNKGFSVEVNNSTIWQGRDAITNLGVKKFEILSWHSM
jgi:hypothetical protein